MRTVGFVQSVIYRSLQNSSGSVSKLALTQGRCIENKTSSSRGPVKFLRAVKFWSSIKQVPSVPARRDLDLKSPIRLSSGQPGYIYDEGVRLANVRDAQRESVIRSCDFKKHLGLRATDSLVPFSRRVSESKRGNRNEFAIYPVDEFLVLRTIYSSQSYHAVNQIEIPLEVVPKIIQNIERYLIPEASDLRWVMDNPYDDHIKAVDGERMITEHQISDAVHRPGESVEPSIRIENLSRRGYDEMFPEAQQRVEFGLESCRDFVLPMLKEAVFNLK